MTAICVTFASTAPTTVAQGALAPWSASKGMLSAGATAVTTDARHDALPFESGLVRDGKIVAVWSGPTLPTGVTVGNASVVKGG